MKVAVVTLLIILALVLALLAYKHTYNRMPGFLMQDKGKSEEKKEKKSKIKEDKDKNESNEAVRVIQRWDMPLVLGEISDISTIDDNTVACIQDETGRIFIYNIKENKIAREIKFAERGDYEGLAIAGKVVYVLNSNGVIYEVTDINNNKPVVKEYKTFLNQKDDAEALCYDKANNRLLVAFKRDEENDSKGIYSFNLANKELEKSPVYSIDLSHELFKETKGKKKKTGIKPSAIAIHPVSGDIYITEGTNPKLLIMDKQGAIKSVVLLSRKDFGQPEGITFNSKGDLFISNEGKNEPGNILKVRL